jgi:hypothetical protein
MLAEAESFRKPRDDVEQAEGQEDASTALETA